MSDTTTTASRSVLARLGFADLSESRDRIVALQGRDDLGSPFRVVEWPELWGQTADPDGALRAVDRLFEVAPARMREILADDAATERLVRLVGASIGLAEFLHRRPGELALLLEPVTAPWDQDGYRASLTSAVDDAVGEEARLRLRVRYRRHLAQIALFDVLSASATEAFPAVAAGLADLAGAALDVAVDIARREVPFPAAEVAATPLAIIAMGKAGARELNYVSDVDVIFVTEPVVAEGADSPALGTDRAVLIATRLAIAATHVITDLAVEPALWEVDANLRPEGKDGALVRTLDSHVAYYARWAKQWEFQALLKARAIAGSMDLGERYVAAVEPFVWRSAGLPGFVEAVQRMRERVTQNIPDGEVDRQLKLGPGGLRDVEFTVQLLQLVHGRTDDTVHQRSTLDAMASLTDAGYVGRQEAARFGPDYALLRVLEHRIQLRRLQRTHLMPSDEDELRVLARSSGLAPGASALVERWRAVKLEVRGLHERIFYRPLLSAVASSTEDGIVLTSNQVRDRLAGVGFLDPDGALEHIRSLTQGVSRRATIQRTLLPVLLRWMAEGPAPDRALLAFRRLSDALGESNWFLRMLRDSSGAAHSLTTVLSESAFLAGLLERFPEAARWLDEPDSLLRPRPLATLLDEVHATVARHTNDDEAAAILRAARRRETLRLGMTAVIGRIRVEDLGTALTDVSEAMLTGALALARRGTVPVGAADGMVPAPLEFGIVAMGRFGGRELGFGSDADILYVYRADGWDRQVAAQTATRIVARINHFTEDALFPFDLDIDLRPEGKNGAVVRTLESYAAYYARWSLTWEAQALLRARGAVGDEQLLRNFEHLADLTRYPESIAEQEVREVKRIKARVESERLPRGADPARHLKLGRGSLSDVEWFVQLLQLQHALDTPGLRTTATLAALRAASAAGLVGAEDAERLEAAWLLASRARSALVLWSGRTTDVLPADRAQLEGVARLLEYPPGSASELEEDYLGTTRRSRAVFEREFYGRPDGPTTTS
ncbi:bifunctional [glutamine synthetase] adenylyltransferase/[glutamine synthetase]-adenylyl-L-tyrosine phosphorylase [Curtobacterium sp. Leaf261]|uniref:bifunctional [glutamine synthetase] adenylyltransferase/[glutamine synthetase]-adenylyl-L-tyrosine phosphorylase n=1 Tax=Curtobacterium sp. Leaf261 TaxID=1736311 RepID=UPI00070060D5|nr:bifunctional [glutamine synthetase] adenylyltransferase/[glutamine synthetase]-adenylyl-L-tyrosine phosphorylase [Curtobacterium sp. Leaf261]KQO64964.1 glutamine-synthetase [Curtobacterium sp. Leaf261]